MEIVQPSLSAGEISPELYGRSDMDIYRTGVKQAKNFMVNYHGGMKRRYGMRVVDSIPDATKFVEFQFSTEQTYILVFSNLQMQIIKDGGFLLDGMGDRITVVTPYTTKDLSSLTYTQSADVLTVFNKDYEPRQVKRFSETDWQLEIYVSNDGPYERLNVDEANKMYSSGYEGTVTITSNFDVFNSNHVGRDLLLEQESGGEVASWVQRSATSVGDKVYYNGNYYVCTEARVYSGEQAQTGDNPPVHEEGEQWDGPNKRLPDDNRDAVIGVKWQYMHNGQGSVEIQTVVGPREATATVINRLPEGVIGGNTSAQNWTFTNETTRTSYLLSPAPSTTFVSDIDVTVAGTPLFFPDDWNINFATSTVTLTNAPDDVGSGVDVVITQSANNRETYKWGFDAWRDDSGYPRCGTYYSQRLCTASTIELPQTLWATVTDSFDNYRISKPVLADDSIRFDINSVQVNEILHMIPLNALLLFTSGGVWSINQSSNEALSAELPPSVRIQSYDGSEDIRPIISGSTGLYVQSGGQKIRDIGFDFSTDAYIGTDLTVRATHLFEGRTVTSWCYSKTPDTAIYVSFSDGGFAIFTYLREQQIWGWCRGETDGFVNEFATIREGDNDVVYASVKRDGATYAERIEPTLDDELLNFFVDSGLTYDGRNTTTTTMTVSGTSYNYPDEVTITSSASYFVADDVGRNIRLYREDDDENYDITITEFTSATQVTGIIQIALPSDLQNTATTKWAKTVTTVTGLDHLNGKTVSVFADGVTEDDAVVSSGSITLQSPSVVVTAGLPYESLITTLDLDMASYPQTDRSKEKLINKISVTARNTSTVDCSNNGKDYYSNRARNAYDSDPVPNQDRTLIEVNVDGVWSKTGTLYIRQNKPINTEILSIIPNVIQGR